MRPAAVGESPVDGLIYGAYLRLARIVKFCDASTVPYPSSRKQHVRSARYWQVSDELPRSVYAGNAEEHWTLPCGALGQSHPRLVAWAHIEVGTTRQGSLPAGARQA